MTSDLCVHRVIVVIAASAVEPLLFRLVGLAMESLSCYSLLEIKE